MYLNIIQLLASSSRTFGGKQRRHQCCSSLGTTPWCLRLRSVLCHGLWAIVGVRSAQHFVRHVLSVLTITSRTWFHGGVISAAFYRACIHHACNCTLFGCAFSTVLRRACSQCACDRIPHLHSWNTVSLELGINVRQHTSNYLHCTFPMLYCSSLCRLHDILYEHPHIMHLDRE